MKYSFFLSAILQSASIGFAGPFYEPTIIARTGEAGLTDIDIESISINDNGTIAFSGKTGATSGIFVADTQGGRRNIASGSFRFGPALQLNSGNQIVLDNATSLLSIVRIWDGNGLLSYRIIAEGGGARDPFEIILPYPSINNHTNVVFLAVKGIDWLLVTPRSGGFNTTTVARGRIRPVISDADTVLVRLGPDSAPSLFLYPYNLSGRTVIASRETGFTGLGVTPGISDDGKVAVFHGVKDGEPGIFAALVKRPGNWVRLVGLGSNNSFEPGELQWVRPTSDKLSGASLTAPADNPTQFLQSFPVDEAININSFGRHAGVDYYRFCFTANTRIFHQTTNAIWTGTLRFADDVLQLNTPPFPLVIGGQRLNGTQTVTSFGLHDALSINRQIAFHALLTSGGKSVVRADVLLDPVRQNAIPWADHPYGGRQLEAFIQNVESTPNHPDKNFLEKLKALREANALNISGKGCALASYCMALNLLYGLPVWTPERLYEYLDSRDAITGIKKVTGASKVTGLLQFDGMDIRRLPKKKFSREKTYPWLLGLKPVRTLTMAQEVWDYLSKDARTNVAVIVLGGHRVLGVGVPSSVGRLVKIIDPWMRYDQSDSDAIFRSDEFDAFRRKLGRFQSSAAIELETRSVGLQRLTGQIAAELHGYIKVSGGADFTVTLPSGEMVGFAGEGQEPKKADSAAYFIEPPIIEAEGIWTEEEIDETIRRSPRILELDNMVAGNLQVFLATNHAAGNFTIETYFQTGEGAPVASASEYPLAPGQPLSVTINPNTSEVGSSRPRLKIGYRGNSGSITLTLDGTSGRRYLLQASPDLRSWTDWGSSALYITNLVYPISPIQTGPAFYRAKELP